MSDYRIPIPEKEPIAALVMLYKISRGVEFDDRSWDTVHWPRSMRDAKKLIAVCGDYETSKRCLHDIAEQFSEKGLRWFFSTVVSHAHDWKLENGGKKDVKQVRTRFLHSLNEQRANSAIALEGAVHGSTLLNAIGDFRVIQPESRPQIGSGMEIRGGDGVGPQQADMEKKTVGEDR